MTVYLHFLVLSNSFMGTEESRILSDYPFTAETPIARWVDWSGLLREDRLRLLLGERAILFID
jgi:hypothetical protein